MKLFDFLESVETEEIILGTYNRWGNDALLFRVNKGSGKLSTKQGRDRAGELHSFLMLDNKPLINSHGEEIYCPTCAKILSIGLGRAGADKSLFEKIKYSQEPDTDIHSTFEKIKPLLTILENGYYLLTRIEMLPTDGEGHYFWNLSTTKRTFNATSDVFYKNHYSSGTPKFILPSQRMDCLNKERVDYYREQIKNGKKMTGLAFYYEGFMSTLLDGHHRATAAYIENERIDCLTIIKVSGFGLSQDNQPNYLFAGGEEYEFNSFKKPQRIYKYLKESFAAKQAELAVVDVQAILEDCKKAEQDNNFSMLDFGTRSYPDYLSIAFSDMAGDISEEHVNEVIANWDEGAEFELEMILKKLQLTAPKRAYELCKRISKEANWKSLREDVFLYLATLDSEEVEDLFIKYLIDHAYDSRDICQKIADEYLSNR